MSYLNAQEVNELWGMSRGNGHAAHVKHGLCNEGISSSSRGKYVKTVVVPVHTQRRK